MGVFESILNGKEKKEKREMQGDNKRVTTKLGRILCPSLGYLHKIACFP